MSRKWLNVSTSLWGAVLVLVLSVPGVSGHTAQDDPIELDRVVLRGVSRYAWHTEDEDEHGAPERRRDI